MDSLAEWHRIIAEGDMAALHHLLAENVTFHSPFAWTPKQGRALTGGILATVSEVFEDFTYHRQWVDGPEWALEFSARVNGLELKGLDLVSLDEEGLIVRFEVLVRPANALAELGAEMGRRLTVRGLA